MAQSLSTRVANRIALITEWLKGKVPSDLDDIPGSLNGWRQYHKPELGIWAIGSKSRFTTTDPDLGSEIVKLQGLITALNEKRGRNAKPKSKTRKRPYKPESSRRRLAEYERDAALSDLSKVIGQWHVARDEIAQMTKKAGNLEVEKRELQSRIKEQDDRIQYLLGRLREGGIREV